MKQNTSSHLSEITVTCKPLRQSVLPQCIITNSEEAYQSVNAFFPPPEQRIQEHFVVLYTNRANQLIGGYHLSKGGLTATVADVRIILAIALKTLASGIILAHNHPSGSILPSEADRDITEKIREAAGLMDIKLLDHLILGIEAEYYSFRDESLL